MRRKLESRADDRSVQGNILISDDGIARLGDFGIVGVITDPTVVEPGSTTTSKPGVVRYMAPELLNPPQFGLSNSNPSKESDVYSLAMTVYEVRSLHTVHCHRLHYNLAIRLLQRSYHLGLPGTGSSSSTL